MVVVVLRYYFRNLTLTAIIVHNFKKALEASTSVSTKARLPKYDFPLHGLRSLGIEVHKNGVRNISVSTTSADTELTYRLLSLIVCTG